ncbi:MAG: hypothetical protein RLZZ59_402 [Pseudomonadota bacterium]|jgi:hypothetical protein
MKKQMPNDYQITYKIEILLQKALGEIESKNDVYVNLDQIENALKEYNANEEINEADLERWKGYISIIVEKLGQKHSDLEKTLKNMTISKKPFSAYNKSISLTNKEE